MGNARIHAHTCDDGLGYIGHLAFLLQTLMIVGTGCGATDPQQVVEESRRATMSGSGIDRVLGFELPTTDWSVLWSASGTISSSSLATTGSSSLALQPRGYVPIESVQMSSLGGRVGTALLLDVRFDGSQANPYWWGTVQVGISIPSLGVDPASNGILPSYDLTSHLASGWNTLTFAVPASLQTKLAGTYSDLQIRIIFNVPSNLTGTYLIDNLRFLGGTVPQADAGADVRLSADSGGSGSSDTAVGPPPVPTGLSGKGDDGKVSLTWNASAGATSYRIGRSQAPGGSYAEVTTTNPNYVDNTVHNGTTYYYVVAARGPYGDSAYSAEVSVTPLPAASRAVKVSLKFPKGVSRDSVVLGANGILKLNDRVKVTNASGNPMAVSNAGGDSTELGVSAETGRITSVSKVVLRDWAIVNGDVTTGVGLYRQNRTTVGGYVRERAVLTPTEEFSWTINMPVSTQGDIRVDDGVLRDNLPYAAYGTVKVNPGGKLRLNAGVYHMRSLELEPQSELLLDKTQGPVVIYVSDSANLRGKLVHLGGPEGNFLLVYLSPFDLFVEQPFTGTIVAPNTRISFSSIAAPFRGAFYAQDIEIHQNNVVMALPFDWTREHGNCWQFGCPAPDQCRLFGSCNGVTGVCTAPAGPDGVRCDDASLCTVNDACQAGTCRGDNFVTCPIVPACQMSTCEPSSGMCKNSQTSNWTACDDGNPVTRGETCQAGSCLFAETWTVTVRDHAGTPLQGIPVKALGPGEVEIGSAFTEADGTVRFGFAPGTNAEFVAERGGGQAYNVPCSRFVPGNGYPAENRCNITAGLPIRVRVTEEPKEWTVRPTATPPYFAWEPVPSQPTPIEGAQVYLHQVNNGQESGPMGRPASTDASGVAYILVPATGTYRLSATPNATTTTRWYSEHTCPAGVCECNQSLCIVDGSGQDCKDGQIVIGRLPTVDPFTFRGGTYPSATRAQGGLPVGNRFMTDIAVLLMTLASHPDPTDYNQVMRTAFGGDIAQARLDTLRLELASGNLSHALPPVQFVEHEILKDHMGAYAKSTGTVYMSTAATSESAQSMVYGIEVGHHIAVYLRQGLAREAPGAEADIFYLLATGVPLSQEAINHLQDRDDDGTITLADGTSLSVRFGFWSSLRKVASFVVDGVSDLGSIVEDVTSTIYKDGARIVYKIGTQTVNFAYAETLGAAKFVWGKAQGLSNKVMTRLQKWSHTGVLYQVNAWSSRLSFGLVSTDQLWMGYNVVIGSVGSGFAALKKMETAIHQIEAGEVDDGLSTLVVAAAELTEEEVVGNVVTIGAHELNLLDQMFFAPPPRGLTSKEIKELTPIFCGSVDYDSVLIKADCGFVWDMINKIPGRKGDNGYGRAMSVDNTINMMGDPDEEYVTLVHEMTHVWQYQHAGPLYKGESILGQITDGQAAYDWEGDLDAGGLWSTLGSEKQASFVEKAYGNDFWPNKTTFRFNSKDYTRKAQDMASSLVRGVGARAHL
jgi:hypothetical protein